MQNLPLDRALWMKTAPAAPKAPPLKGDVKAQVVVIGGGFSGTSSALHLAEKGIDVVLLEADEIGFGGSGRNAGLVNAGLFVDPSVIVEHYGEKHGPGFAKALGLVTEVVEPSELAAAVAAMAKELASAPPGVLGDVKRLLQNAHDASLRQQLDLEGDIMGGRAALEDSRARQRAFFEKSRK